MTDSEREQSSDQAPRTQGGREVDAGRFSVARLTSAFSRLMGATSVEADALKRRAADAATEATVEEQSLNDDQPIRVTPELIVEGALFVGRQDGSPIKSSEIADHIRDVDPAEVDVVINRLNERLEKEAAAYRIERVGPGYRLRLRGELSELNRRLQGSGRSAKLSPAALEVLSVVAYRQPIVGAKVNSIRGAQSHSVLSQLVRRRLLAIDKVAADSTVVQYRTTERFNRLFGVGSPAELPRSEDLDDS